MKTMVTPAEALHLILQRVVPLAGEVVAHQQALGRTLAHDVISSLQLPPFDNSAMDGYALRAEDIRNSTHATPTNLQLIETIGAGDVPEREVSGGTCSKIMTGALLPRGADAVVMREDTRDSTKNVEVFVPAQWGENVRRAGSDVERGEVVLRAGSTVGAAQWAMLASLGMAQVEVFRRPRVGIISTGAELVAVDSPLSGGQIRDSNSYALRAMALQCGCEIATVRGCGDTLEEFETALREVAAHCDVVITSGGVSAGDFDPVRDVLREKAEVLFWKIAMKPGKPVMFAEFEGKLVFGLPGNPVSVMVAFEEFARPALLQMGGRRALGRMIVRARISNDLSSSAGKVEYVRAAVRLENGEWHAEFAANQGSGRLSTLTNANALLVVEAEQTLVKAGDTLAAKLIDCPETET
ncbi:molybdopterin molybdochelatase [Abditibacterium utsteinense]|uniref:Molybdopterin molybdenumtransferase n=2 Tax=Abditibacterium utsteinense TaxID=1960156 RepID=A0A2S8SVU1_9BACT|nr:molybdopterin molybdochelatase [Abditibacterium utsteinense]